jgi:hypothetical protein
MNSSSAVRSSEELLKKVLVGISDIKRKSKIVACMSLVRNSLAEENKDVKNALDNSKLDSSKSFDKIIFQMLDNCEKKITDSEVDYLLNPDNILTLVSVNERYSELIKFDKNILKNIDLNNDESNIQNLINKSMQEIDLEITSQEEEIGFFGFKLSELGKGLYLFIAIAIVMSIFIVCGGLYMVLCKKKTVKDKKKKNN